MCCGTGGRRSPRRSPGGDQDIRLGFDLGHGVFMKVVLIPAGKFIYLLARKATAGRRPQARGDDLQAFTWATARLCRSNTSRSRTVRGSNEVPPIDKTKPIVAITWEDAAHFRGQALGKVFPDGEASHQAQWEFACRGHHDVVLLRRGSQGNPPRRYAWYMVYADNTIHAVAEKKPQSVELYDMYGNVSQWCSYDYYGTYDRVRRRSTPPGRRVRTSERVVRGGCNRDTADGYASYARKAAIDQGSAFAGLPRDG